MRTATDTLAAYIAASSAAWKTFADYQRGMAPAAAVNRANAREAKALKAHEEAIAALVGGAA